MAYKLSSALLLLSVTAPVLAARMPPFAVTVKQSFSTWDLNHDGKISPDELARLVQDRTIRGQDAAALATLKHFATAGPNRPAVEMTLPLLEDYVWRYRRSDPLRPAYSRFYDNYCRKIASARRQLVVGGTPHRAAIHQGADGDCYFLAAVGAMLAQDPHRLIDSIAPNADGSYTVTFPNQPPVRVEGPTDAEIALYDNSADDGIWLFLLEKAYGVLRMTTSHRFQSAIEAFDATGGKGSARDSIRVLTGRDTWQTRFDHGAFGQQRKQRMQAVRNQVMSALASHELLTVRTDREPGALPFKVPHMHVWAVLDFDPRRDEVVLWNPWGNELRPQGPDNFSEGYATHQGVLRVSIDELFTFWWGLIGERVDQQATIPVRSSAETSAPTP